MKPRIEVDEGEVLPLLGREGFCRRTHAGHPIQLFVRASQGGRHECTLSGRTKPSRAQRSQGAAHRRQARVTQAQAAQILLAADAGAGDEEIATTRSVMHDPSDGMREGRVLSCRRLS